MPIGGDDSNDVINLGTSFSMFVYIRARFRFTLIGGNLTARSTGSHRGIGGGIQIPETQLHFRPAARAPRRAYSMAIKCPDSFGRDRRLSSDTLVNDGCPEGSCFISR